jgi:hypothetical protein
MLTIYVHCCSWDLAYSLLLPKQIIRLILKRTSTFIHQYQHHHFRIIISSRTTTMVSPTTITEGMNEDKDVHFQKLHDASRSSSSTTCRENSPATLATTHIPHGTNHRSETHPTSQILPSSRSNTLTPVTPSPLSPNEPDPSSSSSTSFGCKTTLSTMPHPAQLQQPYRFQTPSYVFNTEQSNHLEQLKGSAGCNCKKSRYVYSFFNLSSRISRSKPT